MASVKFKRSAVSGKVPLTTDLNLGELAINTFDGKLYLKKDNGTESVVSVGGVAGPGSATNNAIVLFDGTTGQLVKDSTVLLTSKQDTLVSGTNIKTINGASILGSGNLTVEGGSGVSTGKAIAMAMIFGG